MPANKPPPCRTIIGPNDRMVCGTLTLPRVPIFDKEWSQTNICVWDCVSAHLLLEDALEKRPQEVGGEAFLITGKGSAPWTLREIRNAVKVSFIIASRLPIQHSHHAFSTTRTKSSSSTKSLCSSSIYSRTL